MEKGDYNRTQELIKKGQKVNKYNIDGLFPLWRAVTNNDTAIVELLLKHGANPNQGVKKTGNAKPLDMACQEGLLDVIKILVKYGADVNDKGFRGQTPIRTAARNGWLDVIKYLVGNGAEFDMPANDGATPLESAAAKGHLEIVKILI